MAVSLKIPEKTKRRVERLVRARDTTAHVFTVAAIEDRVAAAEIRTVFLAETEKRAGQFRKSGKAIPADDVFDYLRKRVEGKPAIRPKARKLP